MNYADMSMAELDRIINSRRWVYFIRCDRYVKIGYSKDPGGRIKRIRSGFDAALIPTDLDVSPAVLVATEPGGLAREREIHAKFAHLRHTGEWFTETKELTDYIKGLAA